MNLLDLARSAIPVKPAISKPVRHWRVRYPGSSPMEVLFTPPASHAELANIYPGAEIDMLPEPSQRDATPAEAAEFRKLVATLLADADDAERTEALAVALADPEAAHESFRALVNQR